MLPYSRARELNSMGLRYKFFLPTTTTVASKVGQRRQHDERGKKKQRQKIIKEMKITLVAVYARATTTRATEKMCHSLNYPSNGVQE